jgi:hypothetical protein
MAWAWVLTWTLVWQAAHSTEGSNASALGVLAGISGFAGLACPVLFAVGWRRAPLISLAAASGAAFFEFSALVTSALGVIAARTTTKLIVFCALAVASWFAIGKLEPYDKTRAGLWFWTPELAPGEVVRWSRAANRAQSRWRSVGGKLYLSSSRLIFQPNRLDAVFGGKPWMVAASDIVSVGVEPRTTSPQGLRRRLRVEGRMGSTDLFNLRSPDEAAEELRSLLENS